MPRSAILNFEYEYELAGLMLPNEKKLKIRREFEYIFFFLNKNSDTYLLSEVNYPLDYLDYIKEFKLNPQVINSKRNESLKINTFNWWGELKDISLEKKFNSKITSFKAAVEMNLCPSEVCLVKSLEEIEGKLSKLNNFKHFVLRQELNFSGLGNIKFSKEDFHLQTEKVRELMKIGPVVFSPWFERTLDLSAYFINNDILEHINIIDSQGHYKGGFVSNNLPGFLAKYSPGNFKLYEKWREDRIKIWNYYISLGASGSFGLDSFIFVYNSKKYLYSLCEVNYRKTLGLFIHELKKFIPDQSGIGKWIIIKSDKNISKFSQLLDVIKPELFNQNTNIGIIPTSPVGNLFYSFFLSYPDYSILNRKEEWLRKVLKKRV